MSAIIEVILRSRLKMASMKYSWFLILTEGIARAKWQSHEKIFFVFKLCWKLWQSSNGFQQFWQRLPVLNCFNSYNKLLAALTRITRCQPQKQTPQQALLKALTTSTVFQKFQQLLSAFNCIDSYNKLLSAKAKTSTSLYWLSERQSNTNNEPLSERRKTYTNVKYGRRIFHCVKYTMIILPHDEICLPWAQSHILYVNWFIFQLVLYWTILNSCFQKHPKCCTRANVKYSQRIWWLMNNFIQFEWILRKCWNQRF